MNFYITARVGRRPVFRIIYLVYLPINNSIALFLFYSVIYLLFAFQKNGPESYVWGYGFQFQWSIRCSIDSKSITLIKQSFLFHKNTWYLKWKWSPKCCISYETSWGIPLSNPYLYGLHTCFSDINDICRIPDLIKANFTHLVAHFDNHY